MKGLNGNGKSQAKFELNWTADLTDQEFEEQLKGLANEKKNLPGDFGDSEEHGQDEEDGRHLQGFGLPKSVNWAAGPHASPVKYQGGCGSCWAMQATTMTEMYQSILTGQPVEWLSAQEALDCAHWNGCSGGYASNYFLWSRDHGS